MDTNSERPRQATRTLSPRQPIRNLSPRQATQTLSSRQATRTLSPRQATQTLSPIQLILTIGFPACGKTTILRRFALRTLRRWHSSPDCDCAHGCNRVFALQDFDDLLRKAQGHARFAAFSSARREGQLIYICSDTMTRLELGQRNMVAEHTESDHKAALKAARIKMQSYVRSLAGRLSKNNSGEVFCIVDRNILPNSLDFIARLIEDLQTSSRRVEPLFLIPTPDACDSFASSSPSCSRCGTHDGSLCQRLASCDAAFTSQARAVWEERQRPRWPLPWSLQSCLEACLRALQRDDHLTLSKDDKVLFILISFLISFKDEHLEHGALWRGPMGNYPNLTTRISGSRVLEIDSLQPAFANRLSQATTFCLHSLWWLVNDSRLCGFSEREEPDVDKCFRNATNVMLEMIQNLSSGSEWIQNRDDRVEDIVDAIDRATRERAMEIRPSKYAGPIRDAFRSSEQRLLSKMRDLNLPKELCGQCEQELHRWEVVPLPQAGHRAMNQFLITHVVVAFSGLCCFVLRAAESTAGILHLTSLIRPCTHSEQQSSELLHALAPSLAAAGSPLADRKAEGCGPILHLLRQSPSQLWELAYAEEVRGKNATIFRDVLILPFRSSFPAVDL